MQTGELTVEQDIESACNQIGWYAREHDLTGEDLRNIFHAGLATNCPPSAKAQRQAHPPPEA